MGYAKRVRPIGHERQQHFHERTMRSLKGDFVGQSRLRKAAEEPPQILAREFNLAEVRNLREKPAPTLLLDLELRQLLQKLQLFPFQGVLCGVHAGPPKQKLSSSCPPETPL